MFITFGMFIWLIILTIIMIAFIIYLTVSDGKKSKTPYTNTDLSNEPTSDNHTAFGNDSLESKSWRYEQQDDHTEPFVEKEPYTNASTDTTSQEDESLFTILPYPKDEEDIEKKN